MSKPLKWCPKCVKYHSLSETELISRIRSQINKQNCCCEKPMHQYTPTAFSSSWRTFSTRQSTIWTQAFSIGLSRLSSSFFNSCKPQTSPHYSAYTVSSYLQSFFFKQALNSFTALVDNSQLLGWFCQPWGLHGWQYDNVFSPSIMELLARCSA